MARMIRSAERLRVMMKRQPGQAFGAAYIPAQWATVREAPSISRATILFAEKVGGREVHLLSQIEFWAALLALYHPKLFDLHEQRLLSTAPSVHPLFGHEFAVGMDLPSLPGTVAIADEMGCLSRHPKITYKPSADPTTWQPVPWPFIGDLLLFLMDETGPYCVNWTVKDIAEAFDQTGTRGKPRKKGAKDPGAQLRHEIEVRNYLAGDIRTQRITYSAFDKPVIQNLRSLFTKHTARLSIPPEIRHYLLEEFRSAIGTPIPAYQVVHRLIEATGLDRYTITTFLHQSIWNRELRVNLFEPVVMDQPLLPESQDVCDVYAFLFRRDE